MSSFTSSPVTKLAANKTLSSLLNTCFSAYVMDEFMQDRSSNIFAEVVSDIGKHLDLDTDTSLSNFYGYLFSQLSKPIYRTEYVYKALFYDQNFFLNRKFRFQSVIPEFRVLDTKADIVLLNGTSTAYEIKSERDDLSKLSRQVLTYQKVFPKVSVIAPKSMMEDIATLVPPQVGLMILSPKCNFTTLRKAEKTFEYISTIDIFESIRTDEAFDLLEVNAQIVKSLPNTQRRAYILSYAKTISPQHTSASMLRVLKRTRSIAVDDDLVAIVPPSLRPYIINRKFTLKNVPQLLELFSRKTVDFLT